MKNFEKNNDLFARFEEIFKSKDVMTREDLREIKEQGISAENFLNFLNSKYGYLFHGSRKKISKDDGIVSSSGKLYATSEGSVAIIKALCANDISGLKNLDYSLSKNSKQKIIIEGNLEAEVIQEQGYVYVIEDSEGFSNNNTQGEVEYLKNIKSGEGQPFIKIIEIGKEDFDFPLEIVGKSE